MNMWPRAVRKRRHDVPQAHKVALLVSLGRRAALGRLSNAIVLMHARQCLVGVKQVLLVEGTQKAFGVSECHRMPWMMRDGGRSGEITHLLLLVESSQEACSHEAGAT